MRRPLVKAALNGRRTGAEHPGIPIDAERVAEDAAAALAAGADLIHVHPRDESGAETLLAAPIAETVEAIRAAAPGRTRVGVSTGLWISFGSAERRLELISEWSERPGLCDFASVNLAEDGWEEVVDALAAAGVAAEAGLFTLADVTELLASGRAEGFERLLVEPREQDAGLAVATARAMIGAILAAGLAVPLVAHGAEASVWPVAELAAEEGLGLRVGFEDGPELPDGSRAASNAELAAAARELVGE